MKPKPTRPKPAAPASPEEFVRVWQSSSSAREVATKLGIPATTASSRAMRYRKAGVRLKHFRGKEPPVDVAALNAIIDDNGQPSSDQADSEE
jgi:DNA-directed RNA polymerase specialized sigma24 family protein